MGAGFFNNLHIEAVVGALDFLFGTSLVDIQGSWSALLL